MVFISFRQDSKIPRLFVFLYKPKMQMMKGKRYFLVFLLAAVLAVGCTPDRPATESGKTIDTSEDAADNSKTRAEAIVDYTP
jgi:hypothetical protein